MQPRQYTVEQSLVVSTLSKEYGIDPDRVFFPDEKNPSKPWLGADELLAIARKSDRFMEVIEGYDDFIPALNQVVHRARVVDRDGHAFERCGIATISEPAPDGSPADGHSLAGSRALVATLTAAGFNPLRGITKARGQVITYDDAAEQRKSQLRQIHALAEEGGLILYSDGGRDDGRYRQFLRDHFNVDSVTSMNATERASVINKLKLFNQGIENL
ncbi:MAG TPA: hypothetical protein VJ464_15980 [Blastocatellia bacterium]|nr:hypothetical protein [Blastocatellia bacterium]